MCDVCVVCVYLCVCVCVCLVAPEQLAAPPVQVFDKTLVVKQMHILEPQDLLVTRADKGGSTWDPRPEPRHLHPSINPSSIHHPYIIHQYSNHYPECPPLPILDPGTTQNPGWRCLVLSVDEEKDLCNPLNINIHPDQLVLELDEQRR